MLIGQLLFASRSVASKLDVLLKLIKKRVLVLHY